MFCILTRKEEGQLTTFIWISRVTAFTCTVGNKNHLARRSIRFYMLRYFTDSTKLFIRKTTPISSSLYAIDVNRIFESIVFYTIAIIAECFSCWRPLWFKKISSQPNISERPLVKIKKECALKAGWQSKWDLFGM